MSKVFRKILSYIFTFATLSYASQFEVNEKLEPNLNTSAIKVTLNKSAINLHNLSQDVQQYIFSYLNVNDVINMSCTSRYFKVLLETNYTWKPLLLKSFGSIAQLESESNYKNALKMLVNNAMTIPAFDIIYEDNSNNNIELILTDKNMIHNFYPQLTGNGITVLCKNSDQNPDHSNEFFLWNIFDRKKSYNNYDQTWSNINIDYINHSGNILIGNVNVDECQDSQGFIYDKLLQKSTLLKKPEKYSSIELCSLSKDENIVLGFGKINNIPDSHEAIVWNIKQDTIIVLDNLVNNISRYNTISYAINGENNIIIGDSLNKNEDSVAVMWKGPDYKVSQLALLNNGKLSHAKAISNNGKIIVGCADGSAENGCTESVIWNEQKNIQSIYTHYKNYLNNFYSQATAVSANGQTVIGFSFLYSFPTQHTTGFIWRHETGMLSVAHLLKNLFPNNKFLKQHNLKILNVSGIDASGCVIVGHAEYNNKKFGYRAVIPYDLSHVDLEDCRP